MDNQETSAPFRPDSLKAAEALARHAALAIENAQLFEREQRTIEELRQAQRQLLQSEKLAAIGQMAAGIAHELNTPLTYIMGNLELLATQALTSSQPEMLASAARGAERIKSLAQSLLAFSRPAPEEMGLLDPNELVERGLELCHYQVLKAGVQLDRQLEPGLPAVLGVSNQLEMALINLTVNAVQAMGEGGRAPHRGHRAAAATRSRSRSPTAGRAFPRRSATPCSSPSSPPSPRARAPASASPPCSWWSSGTRAGSTSRPRPPGTTFRISLPAAPAASADRAIGPGAPLLRNDEAAAQGFVVRLEAAMEGEGAGAVGHDLDQGAFPRNHPLLDPEGVEREAVLAVRASRAGPSGSRPCGRRSAPAGSRGSRP